MAVAEGDRKRQRPVNTEVQDRSKGPRASKGPRGQSSGDGRKRFRKNSSLTNEVEEIALLEARIAAGAPPPGSNPLAADLVSAANAKPRGAKDNTGPKPYAGVKRFDELPISDRTKRGLKVRSPYPVETCTAPVSVMVNVSGSTRTSTRCSLRISRMPTPRFTDPYPYPSVTVH